MVLSTIGRACFGASFERLRLDLALTPTRIDDGDLRIGTITATGYDVERHGREAVVTVACKSWLAGDVRPDDVTVFRACPMKELRVGLDEGLDGSSKRMQVARPGGVDLEHALPSARTAAELYAGLTVAQAPAAEFIWSLCCKILRGRASAVDATAVAARTIANSRMVISLCSQLVWI